MFIKRIYMKNFGKVEEKTIHLEDGLTVVRGSNEAGKSTSFIQAPLYAFFGAQAIAGTVEDIVRDGAPTSSMVVEADYGPYTVRRSPTGASVKGPGVAISGQGDVSTFFSTLFGVQVNTAKHVVASEQGEAAGLFKKPAGEVTSFIEKLADFDQIDGLIERVQEKFPSGNKKVIEDLIVRHKEKLEELRATEVEDREPLVNELDQVRVEIGMEDSSVTFLKKALEETEETVKVIEKRNIARTLKTKELNLVVSQIKGAKGELQETVETEVVFPCSEDEFIQAVRKIEQELPEIDQRLSDWKWVESANKAQQGDVWDGDMESLKSAIKDEREKAEKADTAVLNAKTRISFLNSSRPESDTCGQCGAPLKDYAATVAKINEEIGELSKIVEENTKRGAAAKSTLKVLKEIKRVSEKLARDKPVAVEIKDDTVLPNEYKVRFNKPEKPSAEQVSLWKKFIVDYKVAEERVKDKEKRKGSLTKSIEEYTVLLDQLSKELSDLGPVEEVSYDKVTEVKTSLKEHRDIRKKLEDRATKLEVRIAVVTEAAEQKRKRTKEVTTDLAKAYEMLKTDERNKKIVASIRQAKPKVLNLVWNRVVESMSNNFSKMRGRESRIERTEKGFLVDNLPVVRESGSTRSILGVAMRDVLRDVFAPQCGFMLFDEVFADMDSDRTAATLSAIQTMRGQKIVITHEDVSEMAADNFIEV